MSLIYPSDVAFTPAVKAIQARKGSREGYEQMEQGGSWDSEITPDIAAFIARQRSFYLATASADGQPYIQHRGGPPGFLRVIDSHTLGFADFAGNRQYISQGNASENRKAMLFLMDYRNRRRLKIWGEIEVIEGAAPLQDALMPEGYRARAEQVFLFKVTAFDRNCPQHIPVRLDLEEVEALLADREARIAQLEAQVAALTGEASVPG